MTQEGSSTNSNSNDASEWAFDHWYSTYTAHDNSSQRKAFVFAIIVSISAILVNAGAVEIAQASLSGVSIAPASAVVIGAILTSASIATFLWVLLLVTHHQSDDLSIHYFAEIGVKKAIALRDYRKWIDENESFKMLSRAIGSLFAMAFLLGPLGSLITFILSLREVF